ncbi:hypothetical protein [Ralstonia wenshanensis]|uniref:hypothetical protein n=1 Tax=Ralstonia wenshanensis TaxID=2842456 RepID=UPI0039C5B331
MKTSTRGFLVSFLFGSTVAVAVYLALFFYQFGAPIPAGYDIAKAAVLKSEAASLVRGRKILLVGDSNLLFGVDSSYAAINLGLPVMNMGLHGGLPLDYWQLDFPLSFANMGDVVVIGFVWRLYVEDYRKPHAWYVDQLIAWDRQYFDGLPFLRKLPYLSAVSPRGMWRNIAAKLDRSTIEKENPERTVPSREKILSRYYSEASSRSTFEYSYINMNFRGDMRFACGHAAEPNIHDVELPTRYPNKEALDRIVDTVHRLERNGVRVFVVAPAMIDDAQTRDPEYLAVTDEIWRSLKKNGVHVLGTPTDYYFPRDAFFDTAFHVNCEHTKERTDRLIAALKPVIQGEAQNR